MSELRYRADIDGLRAVAVILVLLFHAELGWTGGFIGVDVFFVISGFLITGLIIKQQEARTFTLRNFWVRRIRRIVPVSFVTIGCTLLIGSLVLFRADFRELTYSALAQLVMLANVFFWKQTGYFAGAAELKPLMHTWSLAVEEQFYLGYPFLLVALNRTTRTTTGRVLAVLAGSSFALSVWGVHAFPRFTFFMLPTRAWEMLLGGLIWFAPPPEKLSVSRSELLSWSAIAGILGAGWLFDAGTPFPGLAALLPCAATALLIYVNQTRQASVARLLSAKPVVFVGLISYSLYLWHWPLLVFARYGSSTPLTADRRLLILLVSFVVAYLSFRFVETPWRKRQRFGGKRALLTATAGVLVAMGLAKAAVGSIDVWTFYYPELADSSALADGDDDEHFDVVFLGGSVLQQVAQKLTPDDLKSLAPPGKPVRFYDLTVAAHTSRDSLLKMRLLKHREFDLVVVYHGINDARMNCCEESLFRDDYTHCTWYESMTERVARRKLTLTDIVSDTTTRLIPIGEPTPQNARHGHKIKTAPTVRANLQEIIDIASRTPYTRVVLGTFALSLPEHYTRERFDKKELGYAPGRYSMPAESWGEPEAVRRAVATHNEVTREIAAQNKRVILLDMEKELGDEISLFSDLCHLSDSGCAAFTEVLMSRLSVPEAD